LTKGLPQAKEFEEKSPKVSDMESDVSESIRVSNGKVLTKTAPRAKGFEEGTLEMKRSSKVDRSLNGSMRARKGKPGAKLTKHVSEEFSETLNKRSLSNDESDASGSAAVDKGRAEKRAISSKEDSGVRDSDASIRISNGKLLTKNAPRGKDFAEGKLEMGKT